MSHRKTTTTSTPTTRINVLKPSDTMHYLEKITQESNMNTFMRDAIDLKHDFIQGLTKDELKEMIEEEIDEPIKRQMYEKVYELEEDQTTLLSATQLTGNKVRHSWVMKGAQKHGKIDLLEVHAIQKKELDTQKLLAYGFSSLASSLSSAISKSSSHETTSDTLQEASLDRQGAKEESASDSNAMTRMKKAFTKEEPVDVLCAYIVQDLYNKNMLKSSSENEDTWE